jgi:hypothetical protein
MLYQWLARCLSNIDYICSLCYNKNMSNESEFDREPWPIAHLPINSDDPMLDEPKSGEFATDTQPEQLETDAYDEIIATLEARVEADGSSGRKVLAVYVKGEERPIPIGQYLASDLFTYQNQGKITKEQTQYILKTYLAIAKEFEKRAPRIAGYQIGATALTGAAARVGYDHSELAAGAHLDK